MENFDNQITLIYEIIDSGKKAKIVSKGFKLYVYRVTQKDGNKYISYSYKKNTCSKKPATENFGRCPYDQKSLAILVQRIFKEENFEVLVKE